MKKKYFAFSALVLSTLLNISILAQDQEQEKKVIISYSWTRIESHGSNQIAIWIEDTLQNHICTLFRENNLLISLPFIREYIV